MIRHGRCWLKLHVSRGRVRKGTEIFDFFLEASLINSLSPLSEILLTQFSTSILIISFLLQCLWIALNSASCKYFKLHTLVSYMAVYIIYIYYIYILCSEHGKPSG